MSIRRRKKTRAFTQIDNAALRNPALSLKAKGLLAVMMSCPEDWQFYMDWLQQQSSDGRESHQTAMKELERMGYVVREKVQGKGGKFSGWEYLVDDEPQQAGSDAESPKNGKPVSRQATDKRENRQSVQPSDGFPATINTDSTNTDLTKKESSSVTLSEHASAAPFADDDDDFSPDGGTPEGLPEDTGAEGGEDLLLDQLVGSGVEGGESGTAEGIEDVPPAAAPAVENPVENPGTHGWAILALEPIPLAELQARPARDPEGLKVLRALMQASSAKRLGHLREQLALPGTHRHLLPRLTDAELDRAVKAASHDAARIPGGMPNAGYYALDRLLGKAFTPEALSGQRPPATQPALGHAYDVKNEGARPAPVQADAPVDAAIEAEGALAPGRIWRHKASGTLVRIERIDGPTIYLDSGDRLSIAKFSTTHVKHTAQQAAS